MGQIEPGGRGIVEGGGGADPGKLSPRSAHRNVAPMVYGSAPRWWWIQQPGRIRRCSFATHKTYPLARCPVKSLAPVTVTVDAALLGVFWITAPYSGPAAAIAA